jgi:hypothetical protein
MSAENQVGINKIEKLVSLWQVAIIGHDINVFAATLCGYDREVCCRQQLERIQNWLFLELLQVFKALRLVASPVKPKVSSVSPTVTEVLPDYQAPEEEGQEENPWGISSHASDLAAVHQDGDEFHERRVIASAEEGFPKIRKNPSDGQNHQYRHDDCHSNCNPSFIIER